MTTQKTITISGKKYTASRLRNLPSIEINGGDTMATTPEGLNIAYRPYGHFVAVLNAGSIRREENLGGVVALLEV